jgi:hypothetical protein
LEIRAANEERSIREEHGCLHLRMDRVWEKIHGSHEAKLIAALGGVGSVLRAPAAA